MKLSKYAWGSVAFAAIVVAGTSAAQTLLATAPTAGVAAFNKHTGLGKAPIKKPVAFITGPGLAVPLKVVALDCAKPTAEMCGEPEYFAKCPEQRKEKSFCHDTIIKASEAEHAAAKAKGQIRPMLFPGATVSGDRTEGLVTPVDRSKDTATGGTHSYTSLAMRPPSAKYAPIAAVQQAYKVKKQAKPISSCEDYIHQKYFSFNEFEQAVADAGGSGRVLVDLATSSKWENVAVGVVQTTHANNAPQHRYQPFGQGRWVRKTWSTDDGPDGSDVSPNGFLEYPPMVAVPGTANARYDYPVVDDTLHQPVVFPATLSFAAAIAKKADLSWDGQKKLNAALSKTYLDEELTLRYHKGLEYRKLAEQREHIWWKWNDDVNKCVDADQPRAELDYDSKTLIADMEAMRNTALKHCVDHRTKSASFKKLGKAANVKTCEHTTLPALRWKINHAKASTEGIDKVRAQLKHEWEQEYKDKSAAWSEYDKKRRDECKAIGFEGLIHHYDAEDHYKNIRKLPATHPKKVKWAQDTVSNGYNFPKVRNVLEAVHKKLRAIDSQLLELQGQGVELGCYGVTAATNPCNWSPEFFADNFKNNVRRQMYLDRDADLAQCNEFTTFKNQVTSSTGWTSEFKWKKSVEMTLGGGEAQRAAAWKGKLGGEIQVFENFLNEARNYTRDLKEEVAKYVHHLQTTDPAGPAGNKQLGNKWSDHWEAGSEWFGGSYDIGASWMFAGIQNPETDTQCKTNAELEAHIKLTAMALTYKYDIANGHLSAKTLENGAEAHADLMIVGKKVFEPYNEKVSSNHTFALNKTFDNDPPFFEASGEANIPVGPVRVHVAAGISGNFGVDLTLAPTIKRQCGKGAAKPNSAFGNPSLSATARVKPFAEIDAFAEVGVDFYVGQVGVRGNLMLVKLGLPLDAYASFENRDQNSLKSLKAQGYDVSPTLPGYYITAKTTLGLEVETLDGSIDLYLKLGWCPFCYKYSKRIADWKGWGYESTLFEADLAVNVDPLMKALKL